MKKALLLGAGSSRDKRIRLLSDEDDAWGGYELVTLDFNSDHGCDIVADLEQLPYSWGKDNEYDVIHAYEVLEHTGTQGDWKFFFDQFSELWRILKPGGFLIGTVPRWDSMWAWGDPSHKRVINQGSLTFLSQEEYKKQIGVTAMSDFRFHYKADLQLVQPYGYSGDSFYFVLETHKPART